MNSRKQIHAALSEAVLGRLQTLELGAGDAVSACRTMRALVHVALDIAEAADAPPGVVVEQVRRVLAERLPRLKPGRPVLMQKPGSA